ncbi:MAG TPA: carbonic anhydrase [Candidatus Baltobacteraceae bacterium]
MQPVWDDVQNRRRFLVRGGMGMAAAGLTGASALADQAPPPPKNKRAPMTSERNLEALLKGNARFVAGDPACEPATVHRTELADGQAPFAAVLGCSDSRVPVEAIFDHNPGDIFVVRVAGNFVDANGLGSLEYSVAVLKSSLLLVLGHSKCGAVSAAVKFVEDGTTAPGHIQGLIEAIEPAAKAARGRGGDWVADAVAENVRFAVADLTKRSTVLAAAHADGSLAIHGGVYDLHTGTVHILE